jgi:thiol:disulfide interchange protein DsbD
MFGLYELQLPVAIQTKLSLLSNRQQGGNLIGVTIMGILSALIVGPCVAAPLAGALIYIGQTGDALLGGLALFALGLGMGMPLIVIGTSAGHLLPKKGNWMEATKAVFGVLLLATAIWMVARILPAQVTMLLWASLLIISAVYMGALDNLSVGVSGWRKLWKGVGLILLIYGVLLMIGAARGNINILQPLQTLGVNSSEVTPTLPFKSIKGLSELEHEIAAAQPKPVMLDFYADWCISCKEMEQFTLTETQVQKLLSNFVLLRTDVTANDDQDKALYKQFGIYGPPAILFFSTTGQEQRAYRVIGFMPAVQFRTHLEKVLP